MSVLGGSLLYFLITVLVMMCGSFSPLFWVFLPAITAAASGWLYLYLAARTPRFGVPVLMNLVVLLLFLAAGELSGWMAVTLAAGAVLAELVRRLGGYESLRAARWSFLPLAFSSSGSPLYIWIDPARTAASAAEEMSPAYAAAVEGLATRPSSWEPPSAHGLGARFGNAVRPESISEKHEPYRNTAERKCRMKTKRENPLKVLFSFSGEARGKMTGSVILAFIGEMFGMAPYFVVTLLAKELYEGTATVERAAVMAVTAAVCMCLRAWLTGLSSMRSHTVSFTILKNIRCALADKMAKVPMGVMLETPSGTFKTLMVDNVGRLEDIIAHMVPELPSNLAGPVFSIILVFVLDWRMGLAAFITVPLSLVFAVCMMRGYKEKMAVYLRSGNEMNAALVEYVGGIQVIKAFGQGSKSFGEFSRSVNFFHDSTLAWWRQSWFWMAGFKAVLPSTLLGTLPVGAWLYMQGTLELPLFLACIIIPFGFMAGLIKFGFALGQLSYMAPNLDPIQDFLDTPEQRRPEKPVKLGERSFRFDRVCFSYDGKKEVLHDVSFTARTGQITAIVGPSGSGKSTIAKLMAGFWDATGGTVSFGGQDIQNIPFDQLMGEISYVAQDNFLFDRSIRENIRMGDPGATDAEVEAAARAANCHDFIMNLEQGYDTLAGDAGDRLSGGERQRITIARAMLKKASVIILDEATAFADPESEAQIQQAISRLVRGKTLIVVAHRLNTIQNADQILVIDQGRLAACGRQEELLNTCPLYRTMWEQYQSTAAFAGKEVN